MDIVKTAEAGTCAGARTAGVTHWGARKTKPDKWATYPEMLEAAHQASDHSCVWLELKMDCEALTKCYHVE